MLYRSTGRQTDRRVQNNVTFVLSKKRREVFLYKSLSEAILTINVVQLISSTVDDVDIFFFISVSVRLTIFYH